jgi:outer membrane protein OmpA-like peptidoglycan-associated protein
LGYLASRWNRVESSMLAKAAELHRHQLAMNAAVTALPAVGATDTTGQALTAKLGAALKVHSGLLAALDSTIQTGRTAVQEAIKTGKVGRSLKAMVDAQAAFEGSLALLKHSEPALGAAFRQLRAYEAQVAAEAVRANTPGARTDFIDIDFQKDTSDFLLDQPHTQAALDALLGFVNRCPELVVDLIGHTSNEGEAIANLKLSAERAKAVKQWLLAKGVGKKKVRAVSGVGATDNAMPEPDSKLAATMDQALLEPVRRKNRRITAVVVTPCTAH